MKVQVVRIICFFIIIGLVSCGMNSASSRNSGGGGEPINSVSKPISIDDSGTVPVFGASRTNGIIYVHNNSDQTIDNISYTSNIARVNNYSFNKAMGKELNTGFLNINKAERICSKIQAHDACPLYFTTPLGQLQGSAVIVASYTFDSQPQTFSQIVNFAQVSQNEGVYISSGVTIHNYNQGNIGYGIIYIYGGGSKSIYDVTKLDFDTPSMQITQNNLMGHQLSSGLVQAIEISTPFHGITSGSSQVDMGYNGELTLSAVEHDTHQIYSDKATIGAYPVTNGAILISGLAPLTNTLTAQTNYFPVINVGNRNATAFTVTSYGSSLSGNYTPPTPCGATINTGISCNVGFRIESGSMAGSANIAMSYNNSVGTVTLGQNITWYNSESAPLLALYANGGQSVPFSGQTPFPLNVTVQNVGGESMYNFQVLASTVPAGAGHFTESFGAVVCSGGGTSLPINGSCTYTESVTATSLAVESMGYIVLNTRALYLNGSGSVQTYYRPTVVNYTVSGNGAVLFITPASPQSMKIIGNNIDKKTLNLTVTNNGPAPGAVTANNFVPSGLTFFSKSGSCESGPILLPTKSCTESIVLGPYFETEYPESGRSGVESYVITYSGAQGGSAYATESINYTINPDSESIVIQSVSSVQASSGTGKSGADSITFSGANTATGKGVTLTYINNGPNPARIVGVNNTSSAISWAMSGTCMAGLPSASGVTLAVGGTCTIVFTNVLPINMIAESYVAATYNQDFTPPTLVVQESATSSIQFIYTNPPLPAGWDSVNNKIYAKTNQATVSNTVVSNTGATPHTITINNIFANVSAGSYSVNVATQMEDYFDATTQTLATNCVESGGTGASLITGVKVQNCTLTTAATTSSTYKVLPQFNGESLTTMFFVNANGQTVGESPAWIFTPNI